MAEDLHLIQIHLIQQYYDDYVGTMEIYSLDRKKQEDMDVKLWECFPKTIITIFR